MPGQVERTPHHRFFALPERLRGFALNAWLIDLELRNDWSEPGLLKRKDATTQSSERSTECPVKLNEHLINVFFALP